MISEIQTLEYERKQKYINGDSRWEGLTQDQRNILTNVMSFQQFNTKGTVITRQGDKANNLYMITQGKVEVYKNEEKVKEL